MNRQPIDALRGQAIRVSGLPGMCWIVQNLPYGREQTVKLRAINGMGMPGTRSEVPLQLLTEWLARGEVCTGCGIAVVR